jgi:hypothetical protein
MPKRASLQAPLRRPGDTAAMTTAIDWCEANGVCVIRPSPHQLKFRTLNFYPDKGTIQYDQHRSETLRGLTAFQAAVSRMQKPHTEISIDD